MTKEWTPIEVRRKVESIVRYIEDKRKDDRSPMENAFLAYANVYRETGGSAISAIQVYITTEKIPYRIKKGDSIKKESIVIDIPHMEEIKRAYSILMPGDIAEENLRRIGPLVEERMSTVA